MKKKRMIIGSIVLVILIVLMGIVIFVKVTNEPEKKTTSKYNLFVKYNENQEFLKEQQVAGLTFTDIKCSYDGNLSILSYTITNKTDEVIYVKEQEILIKDEQGNVIETIMAYYDREFQPGEEYSTGNTSKKDLTEAYMLELKEE